MRSIERPSLATSRVDGTGFTNLHSFTPLSNGSYGSNGDGALPSSLLVLGNTLYRITLQGVEGASAGPRAYI
jgi:hypothetical protein